MDVISAIDTKRAVREFKAQPVPDSAIHLILDAGRRAQSSHNSQPWRLIAVRDRSTLQALSECGKYAGHLAGAAFAVALVATTEAPFDLGQAAAYLQLAAWDLGIGSCIASMWEPERAKSILGIPPELIFDTAISFGFPLHPPQKPKAGGRIPLSEVVKWERWQG